MAVLLTIPIGTGLPAHAAPAFTLTLTGPATFYPAHQLSSPFSGVLSLAGVGVPNQTIELALDGVPQATAATTTSGSYAMPLPSISDTADHIVTAKAFGGTAVEVLTSFDLRVERFQLNITPTGTGSGTVDSSPAGISCPPTCTARIPATTQVSLSPTAATGSIFDGWSGDCTGTGTCSVTMTSAHAVGAVFDLPAQLFISPASQDFGSVVAGNASGTFTFSVKNVGGAVSGAPNVTLVGTDASQFLLTSNTCTTPLTPTAACTFGVRFAPTSAGDKGATLVVSASPGGGVSSAISGTAVLPAQLTVTPSAWFPSAGYNGSVIQNFNVKNIGGIPTGIVNVNLSGDLSAFVKTSDGCTGVVLGPSQTCIVTVKYTQTFLFGGSHGGNLAVSASPGGSLNIQLNGN